MPQLLSQTSNHDWEIYKLQADFCKALAHPTRHAIIQRLKDGECSVMDLRQILDISQANLSQHLAVLREAEVVTAKRVGNNVLYSIADERIFRACSIIRKALEERILRQQQLLSTINTLGTEA